MDRSEPAGDLKLHVLMLDPGAASVKAPKAGAMPARTTALSQHTALWNLNINAMWESPEQDPAEMGDAERFFSAMAP